jgi:hypothetical protein
MANQLLRVRDAPPVGKLWAHNFVKRQPKLRTRYTRRYDYQRAKCEDPRVIGEWFALVRNVKAKYGIVEDDIYNFDETGFMMGIIFAGMVVTTSDGRSKAKLAQPGNREWATVIQGVNALGWAIPPFIILAAKYHLANWYTECDVRSHVLDGWLGARCCMGGHTGCVLGGSRAHLGRTWPLGWWLECGMEGEVAVALPPPLAPNRAIGGGRAQWPINLPRQPSNPVSA